MVKRKEAFTSKEIVEIDSNKKNNQVPHRRSLLSKVEPFLEMDIETARINLIDNMVIDKFKRSLVDRLPSPPDDENLIALINALSEIQAEVHYLKAAYIEKERCSKGSLEILTPKVSDKLYPEHFEIDLRSEITGLNWWEAEGDGRWAGPNNKSSLQIPSLAPGRYLIELIVLGEGVEGVAKTMRIALNRNLIELQLPKQPFPWILQAVTEVPVSYKFPCWSINFDFMCLGTPAARSEGDNRRLAVKLEKICFTKIA